jgi:hypothetical protein
MNKNPRIEMIAAALADHSRSRMFCELMGGRTRTIKNRPVAQVLHRKRQVFICAICKTLDSLPL